MRGDEDPGLGMARTLDCRGESASAAASSAGAAAACNQQAAQASNSSTDGPAGASPTSAAASHLDDHQQQQSASAAATTTTAASGAAAGGSDAVAYRFVLGDVTSSVGGTTASTRRGHGSSRRIPSGAASSACPSRPPASLAPPGLEPRSPTWQLPAAAAATTAAAATMPADAAAAVPAAFTPAAPAAAPKGAGMATSPPRSTTRRLQAAAVPATFATATPAAAAAAPAAAVPVTALTASNTLTSQREGDNPAATLGALRFGLASQAAVLNGALAAAAAVGRAATVRLLLGAGAELHQVMEYVQRDEHVELLRTLLPTLEAAECGPGALLSACGPSLRAAVQNRQQQLLAALLEPLAAAAAAATGPQRWPSQQQNVLEGALAYTVSCGNAQAARALLAAGAKRDNVLKCLMCGATGARQLDQLGVLVVAGAVTWGEVLEGAVEDEHQLPLLRALLREPHVLAALRREPAPAGQHEGTGRLGQPQGRGRAVAAGRVAAARALLEAGARPLPPMGRPPLAPLQGGCWRLPSRPW